MKFEEAKALLEQCLRVEIPASLRGINSSAGTLVHWWMRLDPPEQPYYGGQGDFALPDAKYGDIVMVEPVLGEMYFFRREEAQQLRFCGIPHSPDQEERFYLVNAPLTADFQLWEEENVYLDALAKAQDWED